MNAPANALRQSKHPRRCDSVHQIVDVRGIDLPESDIPRVKNHLAKYYKKMGGTAPWERH